MWLRLHRSEGFVSDGDLKNVYDGAQNLFMVCPTLRERVRWPFVRKELSSLFAILYGRCAHEHVLHYCLQYPQNVRNTLKAQTHKPKLVISSNGWGGLPP